MTLRNFALLVRVLTGGLFMAFLTFCAFYLPRPQRITPRFSRDRGAIAAFLGIGTGAVALSAAGLLLVLYVLHVRDVALGFTLLLLIPVLSIPLFCAFARPLYLPRTAEAARSSAVDLPPVGLRLDPGLQRRGMDRASDRIRRPGGGRLPGAGGDRRGQRRVDGPHTRARPQSPSDSCSTPKGRWSTCPTEANRTR